MNAASALALVMGMVQSTDGQHGEGATRAPLPSAEVIAQLPADGGDEFNRLVFSKSPYLLQHARNPVDWHEWGPEAFQLAEERNVPVFLSIGYSTCHWCHVMEHQSFEDDDVAKLMNEAFVCIKVDREERPDIDQLYMTVTQTLTGGGGWPMTVVMTPDRRPFFAGTYFPRESIGQRFGMMQLVPALSQAWSERREEIVSAADSITAELEKRSGGSPGEMLGASHLAEAERQLAARFDSQHGGFGSSRKFPVPHEVQLLLRRHASVGSKEALQMAVATLNAWRLGGVYDQVGLGMHRYSTDREWLLPHFEKMLYDQALCALAYVDGYLATGYPDFERTAREILAYVQRDMTSPEGAFYSAEDADSEGEEGLFYLWKRAEIVEVLGENDAAFVIERFGVTDEGNYLDEATRERTGRNVLHLDTPLSAEERARWEPLRQKLFTLREARIHPLKDDKVLTDWNGLMIAAFARAGRAFGDDELIAAAQRAAAFLRDELRAEDGRLLKRWRAGSAGLQGMLEDHAFAACGLLALYEADHDVQHLKLAREIVDLAVEHFWDEEEGGFFLSPDDGEALIVRAKEVYDGARPSGNSVMACVLLRLSRLTGEMAYEERAAATIRAFSGEVAQSPSTSTQMMAAVDFLSGTTREIVVVGDPAAEDTQAMLRLLATRHDPNDVVVLRPPGEAGAAVAEAIPYTASHVQIDGRATVYVCSGFTCKAPTNSLQQLGALLAETDGK
ncbi:MAG: thioredoxin domain-containing protein [Planctomycetota bacterium]